VPILKVIIDRVVIFNPKYRELGIRIWLSRTLQSNWRKHLMKRLLIIVLGLCLVAVSAQAETKYITDSMEITLRTGPGVDHKIIAMIKAGQAVEVVIPEDEWSMVSLPSGREGWVLTRFITITEPSRLKLENLETKHKILVSQAASLVEENTTLKDTHQVISGDLARKSETLSTVQASYEKLKADTGDFFALKSKYDKIAAKLSEEIKKTGRLEDELTNLHFNQNIKWFLSGAGVLLFGFIIGFSSKRQRRRSSLL